VNSYPSNIAFTLHLCDAAIHKQVTGIVGREKYYGLCDFIGSKVKMSSPDGARDEIDLVAATIDAPVRIVEHAVFGEDLIDCDAPPALPPITTTV